MTTLREAAEALAPDLEALLASYAEMSCYVIGRTVGDPDDKEAWTAMEGCRAHLECVAEQLATLRAALAADAAWRARAEAAIAWVEAHKACDAALRNYSPDSQTYKDAVGRAEKAWGAARRRYEETCRGSN